MTKTVRGLKGWPPHAGALRARGDVGRRELAAKAIDLLLATDKTLPQRRKLSRLTTHERWALHVAAGWLRSRNAQRTPGR